MKTNNEISSKLEKELKMLTIWHFMIGGLILVSSLLIFLQLWAVIGLSFVQSGMKLRGESIGFSLVSIVPAASIIFAFLMIHIGFCLKKKEKLKMIRVLSWGFLIHIPGGTILGAVNLIYLNKWKEDDGFWKLKDLEKYDNHNNKGCSEN